MTPRARSTYPAHHLARAQWGGFRRFTERGGPAAPGSRWKSSWCSGRSSCTLQSGQTECAAGARWRSIELSAAWRSGPARETPARGSKDPRFDKSRTVGLAQRCGYAVSSWWTRIDDTSPRNILGPPNDPRNNSRSHPFVGEEPERLSDRTIRGREERIEEPASSHTRPAMSSRESTRRPCPWNESDRFRSSLSVLHLSSGASTSSGAATVAQLIRSRPGRLVHPRLSTRAPNGCRSAVLPLYDFAPSQIRHRPAARRPS